MTSPSGKRGEMSIIPFSFLSIISSLFFLLLLYLFVIRLCLPLLQLPHPPSAHHHPPTLPLFSSPGPALLPLSLLRLARATLAFGPTLVPPPLTSPAALKGQVGDFGSTERMKLFGFSSHFSFS